MKSLPNRLRQRIANGFLMVILSGIALFVQPAFAQNIGNTSAQEYGDAVYKEFTAFWLYNYNHTAIFAGLDSSDSGRVMQAMQPGQVTQEASFSTIFTSQGSNYYGAYTLSNRTMTFADRKNIVSTASALVDAAIAYPSTFLQAPISLDYNGSTFDGTVGDIDAIRCDGFVEYAYERNGFRVWRNQSFADDAWSIADYPDYHNDRPDSSRNPERELSPWAQRGAPCATGPNLLGCSYSSPDTKMTSTAVISLPTYQVTGVAGNGYVDVTVRATDESGIHYIGYMRPGDSIWSRSPTQPQDPTSASYSYTVRVTTSGTFYTYAKDNGGNYPSITPGYVINVASTATLTSLSISGSSSVNENSTAQYAATATFSDGTTQSVTPTWSEDSSATTISASGVLSAGSVNANTTVNVSASYSAGGITRSAAKTVTILNLTSALTSLSVSGPGSIPENGTGQFSATAVFSDGSSQTVTPIWSENSSVTTISASGLLSAGSVSSDTLVTVSASYTAGSITRTASANVTIVNSGDGGTQTQELISNGGFESGTTGWTMLGPVVPSTGLYPHTGSKYAVLGETNFAADVMYQTFVIPANATNVTLTYWYNIVSAEAPTAEFDILNVSIRDTNLALIAAVDHRSNLDKDPGPGNPYYHQKTFNLTPYRGQTVRIHFLGQTDGATLTSFKIDDVSAIATIPQPVTLSSLAISGPSSLSEGTTAQYSATAVFSDGTTQTITPTWSENSGATSISGNGLLTAGQVSADATVTVSASYTQGNVTRSATKDVTVVNIAPAFNFLSISGPSSISENSTGQFNATAFFSDGTAQVVSPTWTENSAATSISSSGVLSAGEVGADTIVTVSASHTIGGVTRSDDQSVVIVDLSPVSDLLGPIIVISSPLNNATVTNAILLVSGTASDAGRGNSGISSVTVNGVNASGGSASGSGTANWNATINLVPGPNTITTIAQDNSNNVTQSQITVTYAPVQYTVTPSAGANGSVIPSAVQTVNSGASITFTAVPNNGYMVDQWVVDSALVQTGGNALTLSNVTANAFVQVTFKIVSGTSTPVATLLSPASGATVIFPQTFSWSLNDSSNVRVYFATNTTPSNIADSLDIFPGSGSLTITADRWSKAAQYLGVVTTYYWTVGDANHQNGIYADWRPFTIAPTALGNISTRLSVGTGDNVLIGGFIVTGSQPKRVIVRGIGSSLPFADRLANPTLELRDSSGALLDSNDNWVDSPNKQAIIDSTIPPTNDLEAAIVATLPANKSSYTAILRGANNGTGIGVVEAYDLDQSADSRLANISTRGFVGTGDNVMIGGTIIIGGPSANVLIRAIGPSLANVGVPNALQNPTLELYDVNGALLDSNDNWWTAHEAEILAAHLAPTDDRESAILANLPPGQYTAVVRGSGNSTGVALVEAYQLQ